MLSFFFVLFIPSFFVQEAVKEEYLNERSHYRNKEILSTRQNNSISSLFYINRDIENLFSTRYRERKRNKERGKGRKREREKIS